MHIGKRDGCASCSKWFLIIFNALFLLIGIALLAIGIYVYVTMSSTFTFFSAVVNIPAIVIIVLGVVTVVITLLGCIGAIKENRGALIAGPALATHLGRGASYITDFLGAEFSEAWDAFCSQLFVVIVVALLIAEIVVGALAITYHNQAEKLVQDVLLSSMSDYTTDARVRLAWDDMQQNLQCCGVSGPSDWTDRQILLPTSCEANLEGCQIHIVDEIQRNALYIGAAAIAFALIQVIGITLALCLTCRSGKGFLV